MADTDALEAVRAAQERDKKKKGTFSVQAGPRKTYYARHETQRQVGQTSAEHQEDLRRMGALPEQAQDLPAFAVTGESTPPPVPPQKMQGVTADVHAALGALGSPETMLEGYELLEAAYIRALREATLAAEDPSDLDAQRAAAQHSELLGNLVKYYAAEADRTRRLEE